MAKILDLASMNYHDPRRSSAIHPFSMYRFVITSKAVGAAKEIVFDAMSITRINSYKEKTHCFWLLRSDYQKIVDAGGARLLNLHTCDQSTTGCLGSKKSKFVHLSMQLYSQIYNTGKTTIQAIRLSRRGKKLYEYLHEFIMEATEKQYGACAMFGDIAGDAMIAKREQYSAYRKVLDKAAVAKPKPKLKVLRKKKVSK